MKKLPIAFVLISIIAVLLTSTVQASPVSYAANLHTTKLLPVTNVLIIEEDRTGAVHGTFYGSDVPGNGLAVINHDPSFTPVRSLIIGITDGLTPEGADKTQIIMFLDKSFAASIAGDKWSVVFPGSSHSGTIASLIAASGGDETELAWFTDTFFGRIAASAVFSTGDAFAIGEFSAFDEIGGSATFGNWLLNTPIGLLPANDPGTVYSYPTALVDETATNTGPFDLEFQIYPDVNLGLDADGYFGVVKTVTNGTDLIWTRFAMEIGRGLGGAFVKSTNQAGDPKIYAATPFEETGAFTEVNNDPNFTTLVFSGSLKPGETAVFRIYPRTNEAEANNVTIRQRVDEFKTDLIMKDGFETTPD